ncbi:hypothetical protein RB195_003666 [Necator americanus]
MAAKPVDVNGLSSSRGRRRYTQGSSRSKTIELGTLSEVEEDIYHNKEGYEAPNDKVTTAAHDNNGTIRRPTNGTVRSIARHLSERQKVERARAPAGAAATGPATLHHQHAEHDCPGVSHEEVQSAVKFRQPPCIHLDQRAIRCFSERNELRGPLAKWSPTPMMHHFDEKCNPIPHPSMSEFHPRAISSVSRTPSVHAVRSISRSSSMAGGLLVYDPRSMSLMDPRLAAAAAAAAAEVQIPDYSVPLWYPLPTPQPPPIYIPLGPPVMPLPPKMLKPPKNPSICAEMCCGGLAQMLWTLICIVLLGVVGVLITALLYL